VQDAWWYEWLYEEWPEEEGGAAAQDKALNFFEQPSGFSLDAENLENLPPYKGDSNEYYHELAIGKKPDWVKQYIEVQWGYSQRGKPVYKAFNREPCPPLSRAWCSSPSRCSCYRSSSA
jgi:hypothetical protein